MTLVRLTRLPRRGRVVGELQADRQRGLLEALRQRRERLGLGDGPDRRLVVVLVTGALGDDDALELTVARDLEDHRRLLAGQRVAVPLFFDLPVDHGDVPRVREVRDVERQRADALGRAADLAERRRGRGGRLWRRW